MEDQAPAEVSYLKILLVRHGQAGGEERGGEIGPPLTQLGEDQAARVAKRLAKEQFTHIYSSDLSRAYHTALAIGQFHQHTPMTVTGSLREIEQAMNAPGRARGGRGVQQEMRRRRAEIQAFAEQVLSRHALDREILVVAHGNLIRFLVATLAGVDPKKAVSFETNYASITEAVIRDGQFAWLACTNDAHHLLPHQILYRV